MRIENGNIICSEDKEKNFVEFDNKFFKISPLISEDDLEGGKGGNSNVFKLFDPDKNEDDFDIIKFCKYPIDTEIEKEKVRIERFKNEIRALKKALDAELPNIIELKFNDAWEIEGQNYLYYVMEHGTTDLLEYMRANDISEQQKFVLCLDVVNGIKQLHDDLGIYHRDIKPDNIFFNGSMWKIGDLGLIGHRETDQELDVLREKIGPSGWLSPEAVNKMLCEGTSLEEIHCCSIKEYSDVFQLGKLIWYIFEGTAPVGQVDQKCFRLRNNNIYSILIGMLQHQKNERPVLEDVLETLKQEAKLFNA
jgi:serine/threonine protein kinase